MSTTRSHVNDERIVEFRSPITNVLEGEFIVRAYSILSTDLVTFAAYEPADGFESHGTTTTIEGYPGRYGTIATRRPPQELLELPYGPERTARVQAHYTAVKEKALEVIRAAYPELVGLRDLHDVGRCLVTLEEFNIAVGS